MAMHTDGHILGRYPRRKWLTCFLCASGALLGAGIKRFSVGLPTTYASRSQQRENPKCRLEPVAIAPPNDIPHVVDDQRLLDTLVDLVPCWPVFKVWSALHAFRLWGPDADFPSTVFPRPFATRVFSGRELETILLDHRSFHKLLPAEAPILFRTGNGVETRTYLVGDANRAGSLTHVNDLLTACAEVALPTTKEIWTPDGPATVRELVTSAVAQFTIREELEWSTEALARYLAPAKSWTNRFGNDFSFSQVASVLLAKSQGRGSCAGTHVCYALMALFRVDEEHKILNEQVRTDIRRYFSQLSALLTKQQMDDGCWPANWYRATGGKDDVSIVPITVTGHHLEWIAIAPADMRPPINVIERAVDGVLHRVGQLSVLQRFDEYSSVTHVARALCLLKGVDPADFCLRFTSSRIRPTSLYG